ncbi:MAG TPA: glycoside-pentoside-hexuronide (GPH):cation symporter [Erysipelotrichaceae bacterium]|nr:glycoside-pentoside-hexuronide (GPH):cation symporter [Erysipelotrichaceae bacterium]HQA85435.1 glycoside-pentoside-hexuronide (GPH):cation symporter [Erysipelotrichaceae bacterium]
MNEKINKRNRLMFGIGTVGRDMLYTLISMFLMFYLTDVLDLSDRIMAYITMMMVFVRVFDAFNDPFMGMIVDNTKSKWGKFKPWILIGALLTSIFTILFFYDFKVEGLAFVVIFTVNYLLWEISYTANDIAYWSMLPSLSKDQKEREKIGAVARICANLGMFTLVVGITGFTQFLAEKTGSMQQAYFYLSIILVILMLFFQMFTVFGVKEDLENQVVEEQTTVKELFQIIIKNDQLLWISISMSIFMTGYITTTSFGQYYFKYIYGDINMYSVFAAILAVSQITALAIFPLVSKYFKRNTIFTASIGLMVLGYIIFFLSPTTTMLGIGIAGVLLFVGQGAIQLLMLMFISDSVEYGEWKFHKRNDSVTVSLQPFINKLGNALASGIVGATVIVAGINESTDVSQVTQQGLDLLKSSMLIVPLILVVISYLIYRKFYRIDEVFYKQIISENKARIKEFKHEQKN